MDLSKYKPQWVKIADINTRNKSFQYRIDLRTKELEKSLNEEGQKLPVIIWKRSGTGLLQLVSGFRRVTSAKNISWEKVLAVIVPETDMDEDEDEGEEW